MPVSSEEKAAALGRVPLFAGLSAETMARLSDVTGEVTFPAQHFIVRQGQVGSGLYVIISGRARVLSGTRELAQLGPGDFFGELAVVDQQPRTASVQATEEAVCIGLASWDLMRLLESDSALALNMIRALAARLRSVTDQHRH
jgi:CRP-like cAMP-binding protein